VVITAVVDIDDEEWGATGGIAGGPDVGTFGCKVFPAPLFGLLGNDELLSPESSNNKYVPTY
jgi:hypothetical protein